MTKSKSKKKQAQAQTPSKAQMKAKTEVLELALKLTKIGPEGPVLGSLVLAHVLEEQRLLKEDLAAFRKNERRCTIQSLDDRIKAIHRRIKEVEKEVAQQRESITRPRSQGNADDDDWSDEDDNVDGLYRSVGRLKRKFLTLKLDVVRLGRTVADIATLPNAHSAAKASASGALAPEPAEAAPNLADPVPPVNPVSESVPAPVMASATIATPLEVETPPVPETLPSAAQASAESTCPAKIEHWLRHALNTIRADFAARADRLDEMMLDFAARVVETDRDNAASIPEIWQSRDGASSEGDPMDYLVAQEADEARDSSWSPPLWEGGGPEGLGRSPSPEARDSWYDYCSRDEW